MYVLLQVNLLKMYILINMSLIRGFKEDLNRTDRQGRIHFHRLLKENQQSFNLFMRDGFH